MVTDSTAALEETTDYYPYGKLKSDQTTSSFRENKKYTGHEYDEDTQLTYAKARYYSGSTGRFQSQDPMFQNIGGDLKKYDRTLPELLTNPQELNSYSYVTNNPLKYKDPTGEGLVSVILYGLLMPNVAYSPTNENFRSPVLEKTLLVASFLTPSGEGNAVAKGTAKAVNEAETLLFRTMKEGADGLPALGRSASKLGVRLGKDVDVSVDGIIELNGRGVSASPNSPYNLPKEFRSVNLGGESTNPTWCLGTCSLPEGLKYVQDSATHGTIQPSYKMSSEQFDKLIESTKTLWKKIAI